MRIGIIVQAPMGSQRFPGKVLHLVAGKPMLQYLFERLARCRTVNSYVVATSESPQDTPIVDFCRAQGVACQRGPLADVAERFRQVLDEHLFDAFVRVNGDSPLLDSGLIDHAVRRFLEGDAEIVTNVLERTYPKGQSVEVFRADTYRHGHADIREEADREHVTRFFYQNRDRFRIVNLRAGRNESAIQLSVDTPEDMNRFAAIVGQMDRPQWQYHLEEVLHLYHRVTVS